MAIRHLNLRDHQLISTHHRMPRLGIELPVGRFKPYHRVKDLAVKLETPEPDCLDHHRIRSDALLLTPEIEVILQQFLPEPVMNVIRIILMASQMSHNSHADKIEDWRSEVIGRDFHRRLVRPGWTYPDDSLTMLSTQFRQIAIIRIA